VDWKRTEKDYWLRQRRELRRLRTTLLDADTKERGCPMFTPVTRGQFVITAEGITHVPTGATFTLHPGNPHSGNMYKGQLGNKLRNGEDHRPHEVEEMMQRMWAEYVAKNPEAFK
jgi:hypothetical protein